MNRIVCTFLTLASCANGTEPIHLAAEARLWLKVPAGQPPLRQVVVSSGRIDIATWEKDAAARERCSDVLFPITWWKWDQVTLTFTPMHSGPLELSLCGPWQKNSQQELMREEVLWDDLQCDGATIKNGGFELTTNNLPNNWSSPWATYPTPNTWPLTNIPPLEGKSLAASWHNRPLIQSLQVTTGQPVTLRLHARAATPADFTPPKTLSNHSPAHRALASIKRGVNLGDGWDADPSWAIRFTPSDIDDIANQGFDHIRVPVAFHRYLQQGQHGMELSPALLSQLEPVLHRALERKLKVIIDWHHFDDLTKDPLTHATRFTDGWACIAKHFQSWPPELWLELINEPCGALTTEMANPIYQKTITAIRMIDHTRIIVVTPGYWGGIKELGNLRLPDDDDRLIVTVHCYAPFEFTHQGAGWVGFGDLKGVIYPGPPTSPLTIPPSLTNNLSVRAFVEAYNTQPTAHNPCSPNVIREALDQAHAWSTHFGRPIHLGEFGANQPGDLESRTRYLHDVKSLAEARNIPWTMWEWKSGFGYWDPNTQKPRFRKAFFE